MKEENLNVLFKDPKKAKKDKKLSQDQHSNLNQIKSSNLTNSDQSFQEVDRSLRRFETGMESDILSDTSKTPVNESFQSQQKFIIQLKITEKWV